MPLSPEKEKAIRRSAGFFRSVPFADFVVLSGSCARGTAGKNSDIDVIVGCRSGRVWTGRFFSLLFADVLGIRNKIGLDPRDKLCMSIFISPEDCSIGRDDAAGCGAKPLFGDKDALRDLYGKNPLMGGIPGEYWIGGEKKLFSRLMELLLHRGLGDWFERTVRVIQERKIGRYAGLVRPYGVECRIILSNSRIETIFTTD